MWKTALGHNANKSLKRFKDPEPSQDHHQNLIISVLCHDKTSLKISLKSIHDFLVIYHKNKQTNQQKPSKP